MCAHNVRLKSQLEIVTKTSDYFMLAGTHCIQPDVETNTRQWQSKVPRCFTLLRPDPEHMLDHSNSIGLSSSEAMSRDRLDHSFLYICFASSNFPLFPIPLSHKAPVL